MLTHISTLGRKYKAYQDECLKGQALKALIVEDDYITQMYIQDVLRILGFTVDGSEHGSNAIRMAEEGDYIAVLIDGRLPDISGVEVMRQISAMPQYHHGRSLIAVSGDVREKIQSGFADAGATLFLPKPFSPRALAEAIGSGLFH